MALLHWKKFTFFDEQEVVETELNQLVTYEEPKDVIDKGEPFLTVKLTCSGSGRGCVLLGDQNGYVYVVDKYLKINSFRANQKFTSHVKQVPKLPVFITCGSDQDGINPLIKLWDLDKTDRLNQPLCIRVIRANSGFTQASPVTCIECNDSLTVMAVGFKDGSIVLFHGDITKQRRSKFGRPITISTKPITNIVMKTDSSQNRQHIKTSASYRTTQILEETNAFITTEDEIFYANLSEKGFSKTQLDQKGCQPRCCCIIPGPEGKPLGENLFAVGRNNAVYFFHVDGKGPCLAFDGEKHILHKFKSYLVIISQDVKRNDPNLNQRIRWSQKGDNLNLQSQQQSQAPQSFTTKLPSSKRFNLNIYDIKNKYIAHSSPIREVQQIFSDWGQLFVVTTDGKVLTFREKDAQTKLNTLFKKNQFGLVIDIAKSHQYSEDALTDIFKHYGDHLYNKGDYEGAIHQYIKTIGKSEPSYVIKKFLDSKRLNNLTVYLEALHQKSFASQDHTKLLLNCYSKLKNVTQLKSFIESYEEGNIKFDVEIAIKVLRDAGFYEFAIDLAKKHQKFDWFFKIQIEDNNNSLTALDYMLTMADPSDMAVYMRRYGRIMLKDAPERTITMIKLICQRSQEMVGRHSTQPIERNLNSMIHLMSRQIYPEEFFHIFIHSDALFVELLEQLVEGKTAFATKAVHNLLLEMHLNSWRKEKDDLLKQTHAGKIEKLLSQPSERFDLDQALILCRNNRFDEGLCNLYARAKLYHLVLQYHIDQEDSLKIMKICELYGNDNPGLYMPALIYFAKVGDDKLSQILKAIEHHEIIPPMLVIKILLDSKRAELGPVKDYMVRFLSKLNEKHISIDLAIDHYKDDTESVRQRIDEFNNHQVVFKPSNCSACKGVLDLPTVHFLCNHSYHQSCFHNYSAESEECPICVTTNRKLLDDIGSHETGKTSLDKLEKQFVSPSEDIFVTVAKLFGYGLFN